MAVKAVGCDAVKHLDHGPHTKQEAVADRDRMMTDRRRRAYADI